MTQHNAALVEQSTAAAISLSEQAERLAELVGRFRLAPA
jgi:methyl-accepting chemotaxis protein